MLIRQTDLTSLLVIAVLSSLKEYTYPLYLIKNV